MTIIKYIFIFLPLAFYSCKQHTAPQEIDPYVTILSNKITPLINHLDNPDSCRKALSYLDSATAIDSNCFLCYYNKLMFLSSLKEYGKAVVAIDNCIRIIPDGHDLYLTGGLLYEQIGDTLLSASYFKKSLAICNAVLDTMNVKNSDYAMFSTNQAVNLILLGDSLKAAEVLKNLYNILPDDQEFGNEEKKGVQSLMNMSKRQILNAVANPGRHSD